MEPKGSLPCSQESIAGPYLEPDKITSHPHTVPLFLFCKRNQSDKLLDHPLKPEFIEVKEVKLSLGIN
jgi:hypothetical protein